MTQTILAALRWWAREMPERMALDVDGSNVSYGELWDWSRAAAGALRELGVQEGDRVALLGHQSIALFVTAIAAQQLGAIAVPLNTRFTAREIAGALEDARPRLLLCDDGSLAAALAAAGPALPVLSFAEVQQWRFLAVEEILADPQRDTLIALMMTSGSTARPKLVCFSHDMVVAVALELILIEPRVRHGRCILFAPPFSGGLYTTFEYLVLGCSCFLQSRFDPDDALALVEREQITVMPGATVFLERMAASPVFVAADLSTIVWATVGGARVPRDLVEQYRAKGVLLRCLFGQTEAGAAWAATGAALRDPLEAGYGGPFSEWTVEKDGRIAAPGEIGEILIRSASVTPGYWRNNAASAETIRGGWLHTGDLGMLKDDGSLIFVDRAKDLIISGGLNISPGEVEATVSQFPGIDEVAVIAVPDPRFGETPMAVIFASGRIEVAALIDHCNANLADYKVPRYVVQTDEPLPRNASGKILKPALRERYAPTAPGLEKVR